MGVHDGHRQRKKDRFRDYGLRGFADHEVLELLLYYAIPRKDTNVTAHLLLERFGSLDEVLHAPVDELRKIKGMGENAALFLRLIPAVCQYAEQNGKKDEILNSVEKSGQYFMKLLRDEHREVIYMACLDQKGKVLRCCRLVEGDVNMAPLSVRQAVEQALVANAAMVQLAHNHPSGIALPSEEDIYVTRMIKEVLSPLNIRLIDHIVVADGDFVSMRDSGMLE